MTHVRRLYKLGFITLTLWTLHVWKWILISGANVGIVVVLGLAHCIFFAVYEFLCNLLIDLYRFGEFEFI